MLIHSNIDRRDSVVVSKAPFTYESTMLINGTPIPAGSFLSLKVYVEESYKVPYRVHSITKDGKVWFCDATGRKAVYWQTYASTEEAAANQPKFVSSLLFNEYGVVSGHIACSYALISILRNIIVANNETVNVQADSCVLIPQCHVSMLGGSCRSFGLVSQNKAPEYRTTDLYITTDDTQVILGDAERYAAGEQLIIQQITDRVQINLTNTDQTIIKKAPVNGICSIIIDGETYNCEGKNLIIKAATLSDLRVARDDGQIVLRGVLNA